MVSFKRHVLAWARPYMRAVDYFSPIEPKVLHICLVPPHPNLDEVE